MKSRSGFRGYNVSRPVGGVSYPQRVQNLVIRDFAQRNGLNLTFSLSEYLMPGCHMMLQDLVANIDSYEGIIFFSIFTLDPNARARQSLYSQALDAEATLHFALECLTVATPSDINVIEEVLGVAAVLSATPFAGKAFDIPALDRESYSDT